MVNVATVSFEMIEVDPAVGQAAVEASAKNGEIETDGETQTVSGSIDRIDPAMVIDLTVLSVLRNLTDLTVLIIPAVGAIGSKPHLHLPQNQNP